MLHRLALILTICALGIGSSAVAAAPPTLQILEPVENAMVIGDSVTVVFQVGDFQIVPSTIPVSEFGKRPDVNRPGEGHVHLMLDLEPLVVWDRAEPYTFGGLPAGPHRLTVELANNDHSSLTPPVEREIRFETAPATPRTGLGGGHGTAQSGGVTLAAGLLGLLAAAVALRRQPQTGRPDTPATPST